MRKFLLAGLAFGALSAPAMAADMYVKAAPPPPPCTWCGFYIGGTAGGAWTNNDAITVNTTNNFINFPLLSPLGISAGPASAVATSAAIGESKTGFSGGFEAGYNWQFWSNWVAGFETDIESLSGSGGSAGVTQVVPRTGFPGFNYTGTVAVSEKVNYLGTVRARLGFLGLTPSWLLYATGGLAYGGASSSTAITGGETPFTGSSNIAGGGSVSGTRTGWTAGAGVEWMVTRNWTVKGEWLHYDLGTVTYSNGTMTSFLAPGVPAFSDVSASSVKFSGDIIRAGLNYKF
jgi:outer membrane immunogenic protein